MTATSRRGVRVAIIVATAVAIPLLVLTVRTTMSHWLSFSDWALIELRTRDVGSTDTALVGPYSRYGWNHPGPLLFYALALPYRLLGAQGKGLLLGSLLVNTASLAAIGVVCWRRGRALGLVLGGAVVLLLVRALRPDLLVDPWNPYVIVLPMLAVVALCWAAADGDGRWALPAAVAAGSFAVQSHVGALLAVGTPIAIAVAYLAVDARANKQWGSFGRTMLIAGAVGIVLWIPPIVQQFQRGGGNLGELWRFWTTSHSEVTGWSTGAQITNAQLALPAPWFTGDEVRSPFTGGVVAAWHVPVALFLLVGALVVAARRRDRQSSRLCVLALGLVAATWVATSRIVDTPFYYVVQWVWILGAVVWFAIIWTAVRTFAPSGAARRGVAMVAGAGVLVLAVALLVASVHARFPNPGNDERSLAAIAPDARAAIRALPGPVLIESAGDLRSITMADGIMLLGIHGGVDARFPPDQAYVVGDTRTIDPARARSTVMVAVEDAIDRFRNDPGYRSIAGYDPLTPAERAELRDLHVGVFTAESEGGGEGVKRWFAEHPGADTRLRDLDGRGPRVEMFVQENV